MRTTFNVLFYIIAFTGCTSYCFSQDTDVARKYYNEAHTHNLRQEYKEAAEDYAKAAEEYLKAAELGDISSQSQMGELYATGKGVKKDLKQAFAWYKKRQSRVMYILSLCSDVCMKQAMELRKI